MQALPHFRSPDFLRQHALWIMQFYGDRCIDPSGGMYHFYLDDGTVHDAATRHLVSATRFVVTCAIAHELSGAPVYRQRAAHALRFLDQAFWDEQAQGYDWVVQWTDGQRTPVDRNRHMYGLAFVMLAAARAHRIGVEGAGAVLERAWQIAEQRFFEPAHGLYADDASPDWQLSGYRGQNANMHACEAMIAAYEATGQSRFLERAETLALGIVQRLAVPQGGDIWEHYHADWRVDWDYNREDSSNIFRPWGYQPGHFTEWAKLLCQLDVHLPRPWHLDRARSLFERAMPLAWDGRHGGLHYGFAPDGSICHADKYHWVQAESLAAAALLGLRTGDADCWQWYERLWAYCWQHFVDHRQGAWFRILTEANHNLTRMKSPAGKVDYHDMGACYDVWRALSRSGAAA